MGNLHRKMVTHADHLETPSGPPWVVLWDTAKRPDGNWSTVRTQSEASALERAAHFVKLGFVVHAIKDPTGAVIMDAATIAGRFGVVESAPPKPMRNRPVLSDEEAAREVVRGFVDGHQAMPGRMLTTATLRSQLLPQGLNQADFDRAVSFAKDHAWLSVADGVLTLTQAGYSAATADPFV
jgi:hypothetical protein